MLVPLSKEHLVKIRKTEAIKPQRGAIDFKVNNYEMFKKEYVNKEGFTLVKKEMYEMIELSNPEFDVLVYFPSETLGEVLGLI